MSLMGDVVGAVVGSRDATRALLGVLIERSDDPLSVAEAARAAGVSKATAARAVDRMVDSGLVTEERSHRERWLRIDTTSPLYDAVARLLWIADGATPRSPRRYEARRNPTRFVQNYRVRELMPGRLLADRADTWADDLRGGEDDGPTFIEVREVISRIERAAGRNVIEPYLQDSYSRWKDERDRDLIHLLVHSKAGVRQAANALRAAEEHARVAKRAATPETARISRTIWTHATYALNAEVVICGDIVAHLTEGIDRSRAVQRCRARVAEAERDVTSQHWSGRPDWQKESERALARARDELEEAVAAMDGLYRYGGLASLESVDRAGERLILEKVQHTGAEMAVLTAQMAGHPSFQAWQAEHPDDAEAYPVAQGGDPVDD